MAKGSDGWASTGAATESSTIMASAKPPVKHIPRAPTPGPPSSACSSRASDRSQSAMGEVRPAASLVNSRLTHTWPIERIISVPEAGAPGRPKRCGSTTVKPRSTTAFAKASTSGVMPGIS